MKTYKVELTLAELVVLKYGIEIKGDEISLEQWMNIRISLHDKACSVLDVVSPSVEAIDKSAEQYSSKDASKDDERICMCGHLASDHHWDAQACENNCSKCNCDEVVL